MTLPIPAHGEIIILSMEYAPDGLSWCRLYDNHCLGWLVAEVLPTFPAPPIHRAARAGEREARKPEPPATTGEHAPFPIILGSLASPAPATTPVVSPQWGKFAEPVVLIPDLLRMPLPDFLTWLATNNGAHRPLGSMLGLSRPLLNGYNDWAVLNPDLSFTGDPPA